MITIEADGSMKPLTEDDREWALFFLFGITVLGTDPVGFEQHIDWIRARRFSPDEWLGDEGNRFRARFSWKNPSTDFVGWWDDCKRVNKDLSLAELNKRIEFVLIDAELM